MASWR